MTQKGRRRSFLPQISRMPELNRDRHSEAWNWFDGRRNLWCHTQFSTQRNQGRERKRYSDVITKPLLWQYLQNWDSFALLSHTLTAKAQNDDPGCVRHSEAWNWFDGRRNLWWDPLCFQHRGREARRHWERAPFWVLTKNLHVRRLSLCLNTELERE